MRRRSELRAAATAARIAAGFAIWTAIMAAGRSGAAFAAPAPTVLTLTQAVEEAVARNPLVTAAKERMEQSGHLLGQVKSAAFPTLSATAAATRKKDAVQGTSARFGGSSYSAYGARLDLVQPLYVGGAFWAGLTAAERAQRIRALDLEIATRDLTVEVVQGYYQVLLHQLKLATLERARKVENESLSTAESRRRIGRGQLLDVLQIKTQVALLDSRISQTKADLQTSEVALLNLLGVREARAVEVAGKMDASRLKPLVEKVRKDKFRIPEFERVTALLEETENQNTVQLAKHRPRLDLLGSVGRDSYRKFDLTESRTTAWSLSLQLSVPLFSGLSSVSERRALAAREREIQADEQKIRNQFRLDETRATHALESASAVIESSRAALGFAQESVKEAQRNWRVATIDYLQFLSVQQSLLDAELAHDQAQLTYISAVAKYMVASGHPLGELVQALQ